MMKINWRQLVISTGLGMLIAGAILAGCSYSIKQTEASNESRFSIVSNDYKYTYSISVITDKQTGVEYMIFSNDNGVTSQPIYQANGDLLIYKGE